jgi:hypothetical protein
MSEAPYQSYRAVLHERLAPENIATIGQRELMELIATIWGDVELASVLYGSTQFLWERLHHYAVRGYLTSQEEQGIRRTLALSYRQKLAHLIAQER